MKTRVFAGWVSLNEMPYDHWNSDEHRFVHATGYAIIWLDIEDGAGQVDLEYTWADEPVPGVDIPAEGDTIYNEEEFEILFYGKTDDEDDPY